MEKIKILIVEDELLFVYYLKMEFIEAGYFVCDTVLSGERAIESVKKHGPDIVILDINLIGLMDGIETARQLKMFSDAGIIFITGYNSFDIKERAMALNPLAYMIKPVNWEDIDNVIRLYQIKKEISYTDYLRNTIGKNKKNEQKTRNSHY